jgi:hypothetical protein
MKTVRDACQVEDNALSIKLSDQIEQLDELITAEADGGAFFERTHITQGMQDLTDLVQRPTLIQESQRTVASRLEYRGRATRSHDEHPPGCSS